MDGEIIHYVKKIDNTEDEEYHKYIENCFVVFKGEKYNVYTRTVKEDIIDNIKSPWYLIEITDNTNFPDKEYKLLWIFGGYTAVLE